MEPIRLGPFLGANKALAPKLLPDGLGVNSFNQRPVKGDFRPWKQPLAVKTLTAGLKTIHLLGRDTTADALVWLGWTTVVHAARSFNADDSTKRTYYTGSGAPKVTNNVIGLAGEPYPTSFRDLGIPKPISAPVLTQTAAGTGDDETRFYAYAYVSDWDEIGMPAVSAAVTCKPGATFDITGLAAPPTGAGNTRGINRIRIWRTVASNTGDFFFLRDVTLPAATSTDDAREVGSDIMPSATWAMPPSDLKNLVALWNGMMAGISGKAVRYCEPFMPHAWPAAYETLCSDTPIALGVFEKNLVIATTGKPRMVYGSAPEAMDDAPVEFVAGCVSAQSMVSLGHGVAWATADGLAYVGSKGPPRLLTANSMLIEDWQALVPSTIIGAQYEGRYFGTYMVGGVRRGFMVDPDNPDGIYFFDDGAEALHFDPLGEKLYVYIGNVIYEWQGGANSMTATFTSKVFRRPRPVNPGVAEVIADGYPLTFKLWSGLHGTSGWPNGSLRLTKTVTSREPFNLPSGYLADDFQVEIVTAHPVTGVAIAGTVTDLAQT
jgi:hypothetical protein